MKRGCGSGCQWRAGVYQKLAQLEPQSAAVQDEIGFLLAATNRASEAVTYFERATALDPKMA